VDAVEHEVARKQPVDSHVVKTRAGSGFPFDFPDRGEGASRIILKPLEQVPATRSLVAIDFFPSRYLFVVGFVVETFADRAAADVGWVEMGLVDDLR